MESSPMYDNIDLPESSWDSLDLNLTQIVFCDGQPVSSGDRRFREEKQLSGTASSLQVAC